MTVFSPPKKTRCPLVVYLLAVLLLLTSFSWLYLYAHRVTLHHRLSDLETELKAAKVENAELQHKLFTILNPSDLDSLAAELNLVKENNPGFINVAQN